MWMLWVTTFFALVGGKEPTVQPAKIQKDSAQQVLVKEVPSTDKGPLGPAQRSKGDTK